MRELLISLSEERLSFEILINDILLWFFSKKKKKTKDKLRNHPSIMRENY